MFPIAHVIARKRREYDENRRANYSPFAVNPRTGLYSVDCGATIETTTCEELKEAAESTGAAMKEGGSSSLFAAQKRWKTVRKRVPVELPFKCSDCTVDVTTKGSSQRVRIQMDFTPSTRHCDLYFPVSECGNIDDISIKVNGKPVTTGEIQRRGPARLGPILRDSYEGLIPPTDIGAFEADSDGEGERQRAGRKVNKASSSAGKSTSEREYSVTKEGTRSSAQKDQREPVVYYYHCRRISETIGGSDGFPLGKPIRVLIEYATTIIEKDPKKRYHVVVPLVVLPKAPNLFQFSINDMPDTIQSILPLNRSHDEGISPFTEGPKAEVVISCGGDPVKTTEGGRSSNVDAESGGRGAVRLTDYVFVLVVVLGPPVVPQCADPVALLVIVSSFAAMLFFLLTKDLEDYN